MDSPEIPNRGLDGQDEPTRERNDYLVSSVVDIDTLSETRDGEGVTPEADLISTLQSELHFFKKVLKADPILTLLLEHNVVKTEECPRYYTRSTADMMTYPACWASWHSPFDWEYALRLLRAMGERSHKV
jgi:hypothetical protein